MNETDAGLFHILDHRENLYFVEVFLLDSQDNLEYIEVSSEGGWSS
jgi:hypothetical protein